MAYRNLFFSKYLNMKYHTILYHTIPYLRAGVEKNLSISPESRHEGWREGTLSQLVIYRGRGGPDERS